jgi:transmembrane sensor
VGGAAGSTRANSELHKVHVEELIIKSLQGDATAVEERRLSNWRAESDSNEQQYVEVVTIWKLTGRSEPVTTPQDIPKGKDLLRHRTAGASTYRRGHPAWQRGAAAAGLVLFGLGIGWAISHVGVTPEPFATQFITGTNEVATAQLADGTVIRLAPDTRLRVPVSSSAREVWLDGQAYFAVARDEQRPFEVRTPHGDARVLGTRFEVLVDARGIQVVVVEGRVVMKVGDAAVEVGVGEIGRSIGDGELQLERAEEVHAELSWLGDFIAFNSTPLRAVAQELHQRFGLQVELSDQALAERTVTAWFADQDAEEILTVICRIASVRCSIEGSIVIIEP